MTAQDEWPPPAWYQRVMDKAEHHQVTVVMDPGGSFNLLGDNAAVLEVWRAVTDDLIELAKVRY